MFDRDTSTLHPGALSSKQCKVRSTENAGSVFLLLSLICSARGGLVEVGLSLCSLNNYNYWQRLE